jgi:hypothetical protein
LRRYDLTDHAQLLAWLTEGRDTEADRWVAPVAAVTSPSIISALQADAQAINNQGKQQQVKLIPFYKRNRALCEN